MGATAIPEPKPDAAPSADGLDANARLRLPLTTFILLAPLALAGELARAFGGAAPTGGAELLADPLLRSLGGLIGLDRPWMLGLVLVGWCLLVQVVGRKPWKWTGWSILALAAGWALLWAAVRCTIAFATHQLSGAPAPGAEAGYGVVGTGGLLISAAIQEELLFRALILGGLWLIARGLEVPTWLRWSGCLVVSAVFFSLAHTVIVNHHAGAEAFAWWPFIERTLAGLLYGYIFLRQGLAVATLAHLGYLVALAAGLRAWM